MIKGAHFLLYSTDAEADRRFFTETLGLRAVDAGEGWLIMKLPPAEVGVHPGDGSFVQMHAETRMLGALLYLLCDDVEATIADLTAKGVHCEAPDDAPWGRYTAVHLPSGGAIGLYQPHHPLAIEL